MSGIFTKFSNIIIDERSIQKIEAISKFDDTFKWVTLLNNNDIYCGLSKSPRNSCNIYDNNSDLIVFEGEIYNYPDSIIKERLIEIAQKINSNSEYISLIKKFVSDSDGEYFISIISKIKKAGVFFNDALGRLSVYYKNLKNDIVISRDLRSNLLFNSDISINKPAFTEFLMFGYQLGNNTIYNNIMKMEPSEIIIVNDSEFKIITGYSDFNFIYKDGFNSKKDSFKMLKKYYFEAIDNRIKKAKSKNIDLICDLSGGFDSRGIIGGLSRFSDEIDYITFEYVQDESIVAKEVFELLKTPGIYHKLSFKNILKIDGLNSIILKTDGLVNYYTTSICYQDIENVRVRFSEKIWRFGGLGGEFIRHPHFNYNGTVLNKKTNSLHSGCTVNLGTNISGIKRSDYFKDLKERWRKYPEKTKEDKLKRMYYYYYNNYVGHAGGERERNQIWPVHPFWNKDFVINIFNRIPIKWIGFDYFIQFLNYIEPKLLDVPFYKANVNVKSKMSVFKYQKIYNLKNNSTIIRNRFVFPILKKISSLKLKKNTKLLPDYKEIINQNKETIDKFGLNISTEIIESVPVPVARRIITFLIFINEIIKCQAQSNIQ